jgi:phosphoribosylanthranilate isomerase
MQLLKCCWIRKKLENYNNIDLLWFNFIESSKRYITPEKAELIETPFSTLRVWVFWKKSENWNWWNISKWDLVDIILIAKKTKMNAIQIHWFCDFAYLKIYNFLIFHSVSLEDNYDLDNENIDFYIIDWKEAGSWKKYDYSKINNLNLKKNFLVAGWISKENISKVFKIFKKNINFCWVDIASWVDNWENIDLEKVEEIVKKISEI